MEEGEFTPRADACDVARYIVEKYGGMAQLALQKLLYYCQAASLAWSARPMFGDRIEAWANGPVVVPFWNRHRFEGWIGSVPEGKALSDDETKRIADRIFEHFGHYRPEQLSDMTHGEKPWINARHGLQPGQRGNVEVPIPAMYEHYSQAWRT
ncbi:MAG: DUF4065 domain-containing protein [Candidatus Velthaea sp.]